MASEAKAAQPKRNVLEDLDSRIPTNFYWYLAVLACIGGFLFGDDTSNIGRPLASFLIPVQLRYRLPRGRGVPGRGASGWM